ncbi:heparinase [Methylobacterium longum]|uniref:Heparinase n=1 Tax=Methylobacterium longum TaxID=767694 RepID=A0ABT8API0_9HYPH|nr:heparinase [Methylobacterium longum]MDN3571665.1 heparinase [Methylobacterium longum]
MVCAPDESAAAVRDFAALGLAILAEDRSAIDFAQVPGLMRTSMDAQGDWLAGPAAEGRGAGTRTAVIRRCFYLPEPAAEVAVVIRSWRNARPFRIIDPELRTASPDPARPADDGARRLPHPPTRDGRIALGSRPVWFRHGLVSGRALVFKGQVIAPRPTDGALARIAFRDARGRPIAPPYPGTLGTPTVPAFLDIPVHRRAYRFTLKVSPPPQAATLEIGFATWDAGSGLALAAAPDVYLDDELRLEDVADEPDPGADGFLRRLLGRLGAPPADGRDPAASIRPYLDAITLAERPSPLRAFTRLRDGPDACAWTEGAIRIAPRPAWALPEVPDWAADPFRAQAWRLAFQSLAWTWDAAESPEGAIRERAVAMAVSWSRANPWGQPSDALSLHPACMALRLESMLCLLAAAASAARAGDPADDPALAILGGEVVRHAAALAEILAQHTVAGSLLELQVAAALLAAGHALPAFPMARHWTGLAMNALLGGFTATVDPEGVIAEPSYHRRLEILTLAVVLRPVLNASPDLALLAGILDLRLPKAWAAMLTLVEPDGALPPFDDAPDHTGRGPWLERLAAASPWLRTADPVPEAAGVGRARPADAIWTRELALRRPDDGAGWSAFTADFSGQVHPQDHRDCTSFTFATGGVRWITEAGGPHPAARAHNVALPDGREPTAGIGVVKAFIPLSGATAHCIATSVHGPDYRHVRAFVLLSDLSGMAVVDRFLTGDRPLTVEGFLHLDAAVAVALDTTRRVLGLHGARRLHIVPHLLAGRLDDLTVGRAWADPQGTRGRDDADHGARAASVLRYGFSGVRSVAGGLLIAASPASLGRLMRTLADPAFRRSLAD